VPGASVRPVDETSRTRRIAQEYVDRTERRDWDGLGALLVEDVVYEMPQTRERLHGRATLLRFNQEYPGDWHLRVRRVVADGPHAALWLDARVGEEEMAACVWLEVSEDGLISRVTDYWPEAYDPPADRGYAVERY